jgi:hypothetical protein
MMGDSYSTWNLFLSLMQTNPNLNQLRTEEIVSFSNSGCVFLLLAGLVDAADI